MVSSIRWALGERWTEGSGSSINVPIYQEIHDKLILGCNYIGFNILSSRKDWILHCQSFPVYTGGFPDPLPREGLLMNGMPIVDQNSGAIGRSTPSTLEMSLWLCPWDISRASKNLLGIGGGFPNTSLVLMEHGYNISILIKYCIDKDIPSAEKYFPN